MFVPPPSRRSPLPAQTPSFPTPRGYTRPPPRGSQSNGLNATPAPPGAAPDNAGGGQRFPPAVGSFLPAPPFFPPAALATVSTPGSTPLLPDAPRLHPPARPGKSVERLDRDRAELDRVGVAGE